ncbi:MAG: hypothetical protein JOZ04_13570 [Acidimicrobiia bacterium]|nr:hypothetical protein [Acidimicrobiia bacterium]
MDASRTLRPLGVAAAAAVLLTGAACSGPLAHRAANQSTPVTTVLPAGATPAAAASAGSGSPAAGTGQTATQPVRTDDLDAGLQQADTQLSQTGAAVSDADQNSQQNSD